MSAVALRAELRDAEQARAALTRRVLPWIGEQVQAGRRLVLELRDYDAHKTDRQRSYYHGVVLRTIADQARVGGRRFDLPTWKEHFRAMCLGERTVTHVNPLTGEPHQVQERVSTEGLGVRGYADLIERVTAFAATDLGITMPVAFDEWDGEQIDYETGEILGCAS